MTFAVNDVVPADSPLPECYALDGVNALARRQVEAASDYSSSVIEGAACHIRLKSEESRDYLLPVCEQFARASRGDTDIEYLQSIY